MSIKINFCDFWPAFDPANNFFLSFLQKHFDIELDNNPDYIIYSDYGNAHLKHDNCIKILYTGENLFPNFNLCDYALGFQYLNLEDRYLRFPLFVYYQWLYKEKFNKFIKPLTNNDIETNRNHFLNRKFCNFVYSNSVNADPIRDIFFHRLSEYKKVDSGGRHLNNIGGPVKDKLEFIKEYKFTIAFENSSYPGYTTEKLLEPILMNTLPIYFGNSLVDKDFIKDSFIVVSGQHEIEKAIQEIIYLDKNPEEYLNKLKSVKLRNSNNVEIWNDALLNYFKGIFEQPISSAYRRPKFGFRKYYIEQLMLKDELLQKQNKKNQFKLRIKKLLHKTAIFKS